MARAVMQREVALLTCPSSLEHRSTPPLTSAETAFLNAIRFVAMTCRVKPRTTLFEACALLQADTSGTVDAHAEALTRCLREALGKPVRMYAPGTSEITFDESWLLQLARVCASGDDSSASFLVASRIGFENRRLIRFLVGRIASYFL